MAKVGVFTSGGDAPGMNAGVRSVVRSAISAGYEVFGIEEGFNGMIQNKFQPLNARSVSNIIQRGGTFLKSARSEAFRTPEGRAKAFENLKKHGVEGLIAIGGDGTFTGLEVFCSEYPISVIGIPGTIDNDLYGTDNTLGYDTALNTVVEAVDKLRDTAHSHNRLFVVEVMGRDAGFIALRSGIATGAEAILIPETHSFEEEILQKLDLDWAANKKSGIIIVAEGDELGGGAEVAKLIKKHHTHYEVRLTVLGHVQRGGSPSAYDRVLGSQLGYAAVQALKANRTRVMVGVKGKDVVEVPLEKAIKHHQQVSNQLLELAKVLAI